VTVSGILRRLEHRAERIAFQNRVEDTRDLWEPYGYRVTVSADGAGQRITIEPVGEAAA